MTNACINFGFCNSFTIPGPPPLAAYHCPAVSLSLMYGLICGNTFDSV